MSLESEEARKQTVARWRPRLLEAYQVGKPLVVTPDEGSELLRATFLHDARSALPAVEVRIEGRPPIEVAVDTSPIVTITIEWSVQF